MTKQEAQDWKARWQKVNDREIQELKETSATVRLQQFFTLLGWAKAFGWEKQLSEGEEEVRARWVLLRRHYSVRRRQSQ